MTIATLIGINPLQTTETGVGIVSSRVALLLRSAEIQPFSFDLFGSPPKLPGRVWLEVRSAVMASLKRQVHVGYRCGIYNRWLRAHCIADHPLLITYLTSAARTAKCYPKFKSIAVLVLHRFSRSLDVTVMLNCYYYTALVVVLVVSTFCSCSSPFKGEAWSIKLSMRPLWQNYSVRLADCITHTKTAYAVNKPSHRQKS